MFENKRDTLLLEAVRVLEHWFLLCICLMAARLKFLRSRRVWLVFALLVTGVGVAAYFLLPAAASTLASRYLNSIGYEDSVVRFGRVTWGQVVVESISISSEELDLSVADIEVSFYPKDLVSKGRVESVRIGEFKAAVDFDKIGGDNNDDSPEEPLTFASVFSLVDELPLESLSIGNGLVLLGLDERTLPIYFEVACERERLREHKMKLELSVFENQIDIDSNFGRSLLEISGTASVVDPLRELERYYPEWKALLSGYEMGIGQFDESRFGFSVNVHADGQVEAMLDLQAKGVDFVYDGSDFSFENVDISGAVGGGRIASGKIEGVVRSLRIDDLLLPPQQIGFSIEEEESRVFDFRSLYPIVWEYGEAMASGKSSVLGSIQLLEDYSVAALKGTIDNEDFFVSGWALSAHYAGFEGTLEKIRLDISLLELEAYSKFGLEDVEVSLDLSSQSGGTVVESKSRLRGDSLGAFFEGVEHVPFSVVARYASDETESAEAFLSAKNELFEGGYLGRIRESIDLRGQVALQVNTVLKNGGESLDDTIISLEFSELSTLGEGWSFDGLGIQNRFEMERVDLDVFEDLSKEALEGLIATLEIHSQWQANEISYGQYSAQWSYGSVVTAANPIAGKPISLESSSSIGILNAGLESLDQLSLNIRTRGDLSGLDQEIGLGFMYLGKEGTVSFEHRVDGWYLEEGLSVRGGYRFDPFEIEYADILGRYLDSAQGASVSGQLSALGAYSYVDEMPALSSQVRFENGSVDHPGAQMGVSGVELDADFESVIDVKTAADGLSLKIGKIDVGDLSFENAVVSADVLNASLLRIRGGSIEAMGGLVTLLESDVDLRTFDLESTLLFENLSLETITSKIDFFDGKMEGEVNGYLPLAIRNGVFVPMEGRVALSDGKTAHLAYNAEGLISSSADPNAKKTLSDRLFKFLDIEPEGFVEEALRDLVIHDLDVELFPAESPLTPVRIRFSGEGRSGETKIPLNLETNINGNLQELYLFIIRLSSLG